MKNSLFVLIALFVCDVSSGQVTVTDPPPTTKTDTSKSKTISVKKDVKAYKPNACSDVKYISGLYYSKKDTTKLYTGECTEYWSEGQLRAWYKYDQGKITFIQRFDQKGTCIQQWGNTKEIDALFNPKQP